MQYWQYRVGHRTYEQKNGVTGTEYGIVEAYFNENDELHFVTSEFQYPYGEDLEDVLCDLELFKQAGELPPIDLDNVKFAGFDLSEYGDTEENDISTSYVSINILNTTGDKHE